MATELIAAGTSAQTSADIVVTTTTVLVSLKNWNPLAEVVIDVKDDAAAYQAFSSLDGVGKTSLALTSPGTYRARRVDRGVPGTCGVFSA
jgi:hypothetical protein